MYMKLIRKGKILGDISNFFYFHSQMTIYFRSSRYPVRDRDWQKSVADENRGRLLRGARETDFSEAGPGQRTTSLSTAKVLTYAPLDLQDPKPNMYAVNGRTTAKQTYVGKGYQCRERDNGTENKNKATMCMPLAHLEAK